MSLLIRGICRRRSPKSSRLKRGIYCALTCCGSGSRVLNVRSRKRRQQRGTLPTNRPINGRPLAGFSGRLSLFRRSYNLTRSNPPGKKAGLARIFHEHFRGRQRNRGRDGALRRPRRVQRRNTPCPGQRIDRSVKDPFRACTARGRRSAASLPSPPCEISGLSSSGAT